MGQHLSSAPIFHFHLVETYSEIRFYVDFCQRNFIPHHRPCERKELWGDHWPQQLTFEPLQFEWTWGIGLWLRLENIQGEELWLAECVHGGQGERAGEKMLILEYVQAKTSVYFLQANYRESQPWAVLNGLSRTTKGVPAMRGSLQNTENWGLQKEHYQLRRFLRLTDLWGALDCDLEKRVSF